MYSAVDDDVDAEILREYPYLAEPYEAASSASAWQIQVEAVLLAEIVKRSNGKLNSEYAKVENCLQCLREDKPLRELLLHGWKTGSLKPVRELVKLKLTHQHLGDRNILSSLKRQQYTAIYGGNFTSVEGNQVNYYLDSDVGGVDANVIPSINYNARHMEVLASRFEKTGQWFLESNEFTRWLEDPSQRILWCFGQPGAGKTVIASVIIEHLKTLKNREDLGDFVGFAYFDYTRRQEQSILNLLGSFLRRISETCGERSIVDKVSQFCARLRKEDKRPMLVDLENILRSIHSHFERVFLVVDALDEYQESLTRNTIDDFLRTLLSLGSNVKIVITSRMFGSIDPAIASHGALRKEIIAHPQDVKYYIRRRILREIPFTLNDIDTIVERVSEAAQTSFLLARLHIDNLAQYLTLGELLDGLSDLSSGIDEAYDAIMTRISQQSPKRRELAMRVLCWVAYGKNLSFAELQHALATLDGRHNYENYCYSEEIISDVCVGLLDMQRTRKMEAYVCDRKEPSFIHSTTYEYFDRIKTTSFPWANLYMAKTCLIYVSNPVFLCSAPATTFTDAGWIFVSAWHASQRESGQFRLKQSPLDLGVIFQSLGGPSDKLEHLQQSGLLDLFKLHPFLMYATRAFSTHILAVENDVIEDIIRIFNNTQKTVFLSALNNYTAGGGATHMAAYHGLISCLSRLLLVEGHGWDPIVGQSANGSIHRSLLTLAALGNEAATFSFVLKHVEQDVRREISRGTSSELAEAFLAICHSRNDIGLVWQILAHPLFDSNYVNEDLDRDGYTLLDIVLDEATTNILKCFIQRTTELDLNLPSRWSGWTPLTWCTINGPGYIDKIQVLLEDPRIDVTTTFNETGGKPILSYAALHAYPELVRLYMEHPSIDVNARCNAGLTALSWASATVQQDSDSFTRVRQTVHHLLDVFNIRVNLPDKDGRTPLSYFCEMEDVPNGVELLLDRMETDVNLPDKHGRTPLWYAIKNQRKEVIWCLLSHRRINVNQPDNDGRTPLSYFCEMEYVPNGAERLLDRIETDVNLPDKHGRTPLWYAIKNQRKEVIWCLLSHRRINVDLPDSDGRTPLSYFCEMEDVPSGVRFLLELTEIDVNFPDKHGRTPLWYAIKNQRKEVIWCLLSHPRIYVDLPDSDGRTPLSYFCEMEDVPDGIGFLLELTEIDVNLPDKHGRTPLWYAIKNQRKEVIWRLLSHPKVNVDLPDSDGRTPLSYFCEMEDIANGVKLLLICSQTSVNLADRHGRTPLWYAVENQRRVMIKKLLPRTQFIEEELREKIRGLGIEWHFN